MGRTDIPTRSFDIQMLKRPDVEGGAATARRQRRHNPTGAFVALRNMGRIAKLGTAAYRDLCSAPPSDYDSAQQRRRR
jgi:hypothetical protein